MNLASVLESLRKDGYAVVEDVLDAPFLEATRAALYEVERAIVNDVGKERLRAAGELGVLRLMLRYHPHFFRLLEVPELLAVIDATVSPTAVMHLQNGFVLPSYPAGETPAVSQNTFHMDFPRVLEGYLASINVLFAIDTFTPESGATFVVPGTHQQMTAPDRELLKRTAIPATCRAGGMIVFDSTLWHAAGQNTSGRDRLAINHQFTRSWIKQQIDYVRALGDAVIERQPPRTQQLLGWYTRVVTSLDEYYQPPEKRLYRGGQG